MVVTISECDLQKLSPDPTSPQSALREYVNASEQLLARATAVEGQLRDVCNTMNAELGLANGRDAITACQSIGARAETINKAAPAPTPGFPNWVEVRFSTDCTIPGDALPSCVSKCAGTCDVTACDKTKLSGKCAGTCQGVCSTKGDAVPCNGACGGDIPIEGAPTTCNGECLGICTGSDWYGDCDGTCAGTFLGRCDGTCTGLCNGTPVNVQNGGAGSGGQGGGGGGGEAGQGGSDGGGGPPPLTPPPDNAPGNCRGFCVGSCSGPLSGFCHNAPCLSFGEGGPPAPAAFTGGVCLGLCAGLCRSAYGSGSTTSCTGECVQQKAECDGTCRGACDGQLTEATCSGVLNCNQNIECENACQAQAELASRCAPPKAVEVYAITDPDLRASFEKHGAELGKTLAELASLRRAFSFISDRTYASFAAIGASGDIVRACTAKGLDNVTAADGLIRATLVADPTVRKYQ